MTGFPKAAATPALERSSRASLRGELSVIAWWVLVGSGAGALAGLVIGGIGGRLAMLLLRLTSSDIVIGLTSDDGFVMGVVSTKTLSLLLLTTALGAANGALYAALRVTIPTRLRLPLWSAFAGTAGGANFVHADGVDFTLVSPALLGIGLFVLLPAAAAALVVTLVERWIDRPAWQDRRLSALIVGASLASTLALLPAALVASFALAVRGAGLRERLVRAGRLAVPVALAAVAVVAGIDLVVEAGKILR